MGFATRIREVPRLGVGISCEFDAVGRPALDPLVLREEAPGLIHFLEIGADVERGLDHSMRAWAAAGLPATYHFLDVNLAEEEDVDGPWVERTVAQAREVNAAWLCGDAGFWHLGRRERGHGLLLPPILRLDAAIEMARAIRRLKRLTGMLVVPENPAATAFVGRLHLLDFFARVIDGCDSGFVLDVAHLAIFQRMRGHRPTDGLDGFPVERIVELHVAGGSAREHRGLPWIDDDHSPEPLADTWQILEAVLPRAKNLKAIVYECEHNALDEVLPGFERLNELFPKEADESPSENPISWRTRSAELEERGQPDRPLGETRVRSSSRPSAGAVDGQGSSHEALARVVIRMHFDPALVEAVHRSPESALAGLPITAQEREDLLAVDPRAFGVDPLRRSRALRDLVEEYKTSSTSVLAATGRIASLDAFFSGRHFHDEVQRRGSLAVAFAAFLRTFAAHPAAPPQLADTIRLEGAMARLRRELETPPAPPPPGRYRRAPATSGVRVDGSTLEVVNVVERWLFEAALVPALSLCDDAPGLPPLPAPRPDAPRFLLLSPDGGGRIVLTGPGRAAVEALISLEEPLDEGSFAARATTRGLRSDQARRLLAELVGTGLVIQGGGGRERNEERPTSDRSRASHASSVPGPIGDGAAR